MAGRRLEGKRILVTGAARGIGLAIARACLDEGATVYLSDIRDEEGAKAAAEIGATYLHLDVRSQSDWASALESIGGLHGLINNAGITGFGDESLGPQDAEHCSLEDWRAVHATNLDGVFLGCRHAIAAMKAGGGSIVNIASRSGKVGVGGAVAYASSKAAVINHTRSVALCCTERGYPVRCNAVSPGAILTPMWEALLEHAPDREAAIAEFAAEVPLRRMGSPEDVASLAVYLLSDESAYVTGAEFAVDGGLTAGTAAQPKK
ncbi:short-chain dehydrogenase [Leptolyngbya valderiana BDU 20041]|nr:short-chain dehydrogenase [Leptolyngbya valderiana BDU 20041]